ncbi:rhomboid family intramembrane serine protease [Ahniella affigens]|uniref:rhomboid family intramembrane serine protease n=1 Tax=Ahniella affigens TaxID=2021234 RepID=UPI001475CCAC|nr:rhomboid family intramembrane serine protease [Ahniella affigens]
MHERPLTNDDPPTRTPITIGLIVLCTAAFFVDATLDHQLLEMFALWPLTGPFAPWQLLTHMFLHGSPEHLFFNMYGFYLFGSPIERAVGRYRYVLLIGTGALTAGLVQLLANAIEQSAAATVGASGALFGLLYVFARLFPKARIVPLIPPIPMPAWLFVLLYALVELYLGFSQADTQIAHFAHLGGLLGGFLVFAGWRLISRRRQLPP